MKRLYSSPLPEVAQPDDRDRQRSQLSEFGVLQTDGSVVEQLSSEPGVVELRGQYRFGEPHARIAAEELEELASSSFAALPLFREGDRRWPGAGFYELESADVEPAHPNREDVYEYDLVLAKKGTRSDRYRAIEVNPREATHDFGDGDEALVALPDDVRKTQWYAADGSTTIASPDSTVAAEFGDVDLFDLDTAPSDLRALIYETDKSTDATTDARVFDARGFDDRVPDDTREWQIVFSTDHEFDGDVVLDTGRLRVRLDDDAGTIEAETWDGGAGDWTDEALSQPAGVELFDVDITSIGMVRVAAQLTFKDGGDLFALDAIVARGLGAVLFDIPSNEEGPIPTELNSWLDPIAAETEIDTQAQKTLISRNDVRR